MPKRKLLKMKKSEGQLPNLLPRKRKEVRVARRIRMMKRKRKKKSHKLRLRRNWICFSLTILEQP